MKAQLALLVASLVVAGNISPAKAECCPKTVVNYGTMDPKYWFNFKCCDGSHPNPYCAHGECNIFGCNCDGGCKVGSFCSRRKRSAGEEAAETLAQFDSDSDGKLSLEEVRTTIAGSHRHPLGRLSSSQLERHFLDLDLDNDGYISVQEMDSSA